MSDKQIQGYKIIFLDELLKLLGEERTRQILSSFSSPLNSDVESFLKTKAIPFDKQSISKTYLVFASYCREVVLVGYFTLAHKVFVIPAKNISSKLKSRINKFSSRDCKTDEYIISAPLIAQLSKNFTNNYDKLIIGDELLKMACDMVSEIHMRLGGRIVYVECEDNFKLRSFYERNGFVVFSERQLDAKSQEEMHVKYLLQLLRYL